MGKAKTKDETPRRPREGEEPRYRLGVQLRILRLALGVSQRAMLDETGISKATFSFAEVGKRHPRGETLQKLANKYGVDFTYWHRSHADPSEEELWTAAERLAESMGWPVPQRST